MPMDMLAKGIAQDIRVLYMVQLEQPIKQAHLELYPEFEFVTP